MPSPIRGQRRQIAQAEQGSRCPLTESLDILDHIDLLHRSLSYCADLPLDLAYVHQTHFIMTCLKLYFSDDCAYISLLVVL